MSFDFTSLLLKYADNNHQRILKRIDINNVRSDYTGQSNLKEEMATLLRMAQFCMVVVLVCVLVSFQRISDKICDDKLVLRLKADSSDLI